MTSARRVAFSLFGVAAACGVVLLFTMSSAKGQNAAAPLTPSTPGSPPSGAPSAAGATGAAPAAGGIAPSGTPQPSFTRVVGVPPVRTGNKPLSIAYGGGESIDIQGRYIYSLLSQAGCGQYTMILDPRSAARPSFIIEKLIVLAQQGDSGGTANNNNTGQSGSSSRDSGSSANSGTTTGSTSNSKGATQSLIGQVQAYVTAELTRGTGRTPGAHREKLLHLSAAITIIQDIYSDDRLSELNALINDKKVNVYDIVFSDARTEARKGDDFVPVTY